MGGGTVAEAPDVVRSEVRRPRTVTRLRWIWTDLIRKKPLGALGGFFILLLVLMAMFAPLLAPYDPIQINSAARLQPPNLSYLLGTDDFGRDILSRVIYGARISMYIGLGAVSLSTCLATILGVL